MQKYKYPLPEGSIIAETPEVFWLNLVQLCGVISSIFWIYYAAFFVEIFYKYEMSLFIICILIARLVEAAGIHLARNENSYDSLELKPEGMLYRRAHNGGGGLTLEWPTLRKVEISPRKLFRASQVVLTFDGRFQLSVDWKSILGTTDRETFFISVRTWAPQALIIAPSAKEQGPKTTKSYTELWLDSNTQIEKRLISDQSLPTGTILSGKYQIINVLSGGGQGTAYLASDLSNQDDTSSVVVKEFILPNRSSSLRTIAANKLEKEVQILQRIDSDHIVKVKDFFIEDMRGYIVMEYVEGMSLKDLVNNQGCQPEDFVIELGVQICQIATHLHCMTPPIVHGDLTPDNLILQPDGALKLVDFDVAQEVMSTAARTVVGKNAYMSPEQFKGRMDTKSDVYSIGCTLFYLLSGEEPIPLTVSHPRELTYRVSESLDFLVAGATNPEPGRRPTAHLLAVQLDQLRSKL